MSRLSKNIVYNVFGQGALIVLNLLAVKFIFRGLGDDALGIIFFTQTLNVVLGDVLARGFSSAITREVTAHLHNDPGYVRKLISTFSTLYWGAYALLATVVILSSPMIAGRWVNLESMDVATATQALRILGVSMLLALPRAFYAAVMRGLERMEFNNFIDVSVLAVQQLGIILILTTGRDLSAVSWWIAGCMALSVLFYILVCGRFLSFRSLVPAFSPAVFMRNLGYSLKMLTISLFSTIHSQADKVVISRLLPMGALGYYGAAYSTVFKGAFIARSVSQAAFPSFSFLFENGGHKDLIVKYRKLQDFLCFLSMPVFSAIVFAELPVFTYLFDVSIAQMLLLPVILLCVGSYMNVTLAVPYTLAPAVGKPGIIARSHFFAIFVTIPSAVLFIYFFGLKGAAISLVFYNLFEYYYAIPRICSECLGIRAWAWYRHVLNIIALEALTYGIAFAALLFTGSLSVISLALTYLGASALYFIGSYFLVGVELRESFLVFYRKVIPHAA